MMRHKHLILRMLTYFIAGWFIFSTAIWAHASPIIPKTLGIASFQNNTSRKGLDQLLTMSLLTEILHSDKFYVIDRLHLDKILNEQSLSRTGIISQDTSIPMGSINGIQYLLTGTILDINPAAHAEKNKNGLGISVFWELIDTESGNIVLANTSTGFTEKLRTKKNDLSATYSPTDYNNAIRNVSHKIHEEIEKNIVLQPLQAHIAATNKGIIFIDVGSNKDVRPGQIFSIYAEDILLQSPVNGEVLGKQPRLIGRLRIDTVETKYSSGTLVSGDILLVKTGAKVMRL